MCVYTRILSTGPQPTDAKYASWKQAAKFDQGMKKENTLKAQMLAGQPH